MARRPADPGSEDGWRVIDAAVASARARLGDGLLSAYAIGSLAHGGFAVAVSDVDLALLTDARTDRDMSAIAAAVAADVARAGLALGNRLSIFHAPWDRFPDPPGGARFPPIDRYDLVRYGVLVGGEDLRTRYAVAPSAEDIRAQAVESALRRVTPEQLSAELHALEAGQVSVHDATKTVLWPVRLQHVCDTGRPTGNRAAVEHYRGISDARHRPLAADALGWRDLHAIPDAHTALRQITDEIHDLHAEVLDRVGRLPGVPHAAELRDRARLIATLSTY